MMTGYPMRKVETLRYDSHREETMMPPMDVLVIELDNGTVLRVPNGGWTPDNPALQVLAFLGVSPSTMDEAEGERFLPVEVEREGEGTYEYQVPDMVFANGEASLRRAEWFVPADEGTQVEVESPNRDSGGSNEPAA